MPLGSYFDASCSLTCSSCTPAEFVSQPDPNSAANLKVKQITDSPKDLQKHKLTTSADHPQMDAIINYPNPFKDITVIVFAIKKGYFVTPFF